MESRSNGASEYIFNDPTLLKLCRIFPEILARRASPQLIYDLLVQISRRQFKLSVLPKENSRAN